MSNDLVYNALMSQLPGGRKTTSSNWVSYSGPCCVHNGQSRPDTKKRSGIKYDAADGRTSVYCFNCQFSAWWNPGRMLSSRLKDYLGWLGMGREEINKLDFKTWQLKQNVISNPDYVAPAVIERLSFQSATLPRGAMPITMWLDEECEDENFHQALGYLMERGDDIFEATDYYWTPSTKDQMNQRIIIPFYWEDELVGWTGRLTVPGNRRYHSEVQPHYVFNTNVIKSEWEYLFLTEGPFDGLAVHGLAMLGDKVTTEQIQWLNQTGKTVIVVPDRVEQGGRLVQTAIDQGWYVSFPHWDRGIKDAADAVKAYGRLYTIWSIIDARTKNRLEISVKRQSLR